MLYVRKDKGRRGKWSKRKQVPNIEPSLNNSCKCKYISLVLKQEKNSALHASSKLFRKDSLRDEAPIQPLNSQSNKPQKSPVCEIVNKQKEDYYANSNVKLLLERKQYNAENMKRETLILPFGVKYTLNYITCGEVSAIPGRYTKNLMQKYCPNNNV